MNNQPKKRLFLALNLPQDIKAVFVPMLKRLEETNRHIRWVDAGNLHLTLHFLGDIAADREQELIFALGGIASGREIFRFALGGLDAFPALASPRIVFVRCRQVNGDGARELREDLGKVLITEGISPDVRDWKPHITLGRIRDNRDGEKLRFDGVEMPTGNFEINSFELMESELTATGAVYAIVQSFKLSL